MKPNYRAALDAAIAFSFHFESHRRGASEHGCWAFIGAAFIAAKNEFHNR
jgi:hypothetical protein